MYTLGVVEDPARKASSVAEQELKKSDIKEHSGDSPAPIL
jgi:hypothetical protein